MCYRLPRFDDPGRRSRECSLALLVALAGLGAAAPPIASQDRPRHPPVILAFAISDSLATVAAGAPVPLVHRVVGTRPTHYRVSQRTDFAGAAWLPYREQPVWQAARSGPGASCPGRPGGVVVRLYFQVRTVLGHEVRIVDGHRVLTPMTAESNVQTDTVCVLDSSPGNHFD